MNFDNGRKDIKIIIFVFAFFSISLLLFGGNSLMVSYSQSQQVQSQANQQAQQLEEQQEIPHELQLLQKQQQVPKITEEDEETAENISGHVENISGSFTYDTDVPSIRDLRKIQTETPPGSPLRDKVLGTALGPDFRASIANLTSSGNLTSAIGNMEPQQTHFFQQIHQIQVQFQI